MMLGCDQGGFPFREWSARRIMQCYFTFFLNRRLIVCNIQSLHGACPKRVLFGTLLHRTMVAEGLSDETSWSLAASHFVKSCKLLQGSFSQVCWFLPETIVIETMNVATAVVLLHCCVPEWWIGPSPQLLHQQHAIICKHVVMLSVSLHQ